MESQFILLETGRVPHTHMGTERRTSHTLTSSELEIESHGKVKQAGQEWPTEMRWNPGTFRSETRSLNPHDPQLNDTIFFSKKTLQTSQIETRVSIRVLIK